jgi:hypothetical protein
MKGETDAAAPIFRKVKKGALFRLGWENCGFSSVPRVKFTVTLRT